MRDPRIRTENKKENQKKGKNENCVWEGGWGWEGLNSNIIKIAYKFEYKNNLAYFGGDIAHVNGLKGKIFHTNLP